LIVKWNGDEKQGFPSVGSCSLCFHLVIRPFSWLDEATNRLRREARLRGDVVSERRNHFALPLFAASKLKLILPIATLPCLRELRLIDLFAPLEHIAPLQHGQLVANQILIDLSQLDVKVRKWTDRGGNLFPLQASAFRTLLCPAC
jgi:hypothetical protein